MMPSLTTEELKKRSIEFVDRLGNRYDTTSSEINGLLDNDFAVQHGDKPPSTGGREAFLSNLGQRLKLAKGKVSVEIKHVVAEITEHGGQCWVYSRKNTPFGSTSSLDMIWFNADGRITLCRDLHSPKEETWSRFFGWLGALLFE